MGSAVKFNLTEDRARRILEKHKLGRLRTIKRFEKGMINDVFSINDKYVIKVNTGHPELNKLEKEAFVYGLLLQQGVPTPRVLAVDNSRITLDYPYAIMTRIDGVPLSSIFDKLSKPEQMNMLTSLGRLLARIHSITFEKFGDEFDGQTLGTFDTWEKFVLSVLDESFKGIEKNEVLGKDKLDEIKKLVEINRKLFSIKIKPSLTHNNFIFDNILVTPDSKVNGIVDWEWASARHNESELAVVLYRVLKMDKEQVDVFLSGYKEIHKVSEEFERRIYLYTLFYYLKVLPEIHRWMHKPEKQREYLSETEKLVENIKSMG